MVMLIFQIKEVIKHIFYLYTFLPTGYYQKNKERLQKEALEKKSKSYKIL